MTNQTLNVALKPMASAPKPKGEEYFKLLVLAEWTECGQVVRDWKLVYWVDPWDGMPGGWCHRGHGDFVTALGWVLCTKDLPIE